MPELKIRWKSIKKIDLIACGTSFYASQIATYWFENYLGITSTAHLASEYRYKKKKNKKRYFVYFYF